MRGVAQLVDISFPSWVTDSSPVLPGGLPPGMCARGSVCAHARPATGRWLGPDSPPAINQLILDGGSVHRDLTGFLTGCR